MSENSTPEERTELPTDKRLGQLRKEGAMHLSQDVVQVMSLMTGFLVLGLVADRFFNGMKIVMVRTFNSIGDTTPLDLQRVRAALEDSFRLMTPWLLVVGVTVSFVASIATLYQTSWNIREKLIQFRWMFLNPITGLKRILSIQGVVNTLKAIVKLCLMIPIAFFALKALAPQMLTLMHMDIPGILELTAQGMDDIFWRILYVLIVLAVFDYMWTKFQWFRTNKMTKEEVKDERKAVEGDETTRRKIQQRGFQRIMQRLKQSVPKADVVVTNPTHYAVALKYDRSTMRAPTVVAKGKGFLALRIREMAREANVPVLERKPLARALYASVEVGSEIPYELFRAVAEVLAYVYRLKNPHRYQNQESAK